MRVLLQRVTAGSVDVEGGIVGRIDHGLVMLVGVGEDDREEDADRLADKVTSLRIFSDDQGRFDRSLLDVGGGALVISQFTLYADCRKGRRPSFTGAARPEVAQPIVDRFATRLEELGVDPVETGRFGAHMDVGIQNDGPVTIWLDSTEV